MVHEYIGGCSVNRRDTMSTLEDIMSTFWGDIMMHLGDTMSTLGDVQYIKGYHEYIGGCSVQFLLHMHPGILPMY